MWLRNSWNIVFGGSGKPDIVIVGGWPFFSSIPLFHKNGIPVVFLDCGAVPLTGYTNGSLTTQKKLQDLRKKFLPYTSAIVAISDFIATSQSKPDTNNQLPVITILLGADHLNFNIWQSGNSYNQEILDTLLKSIKDQGKKCILNLGRWEPNCYKNSEAIFNIMRRIITKNPDSVLLYLPIPQILKYLLI